MKNSSKATRFFKKNGYLMILLASVMAVIVLVVVAFSMNTTNNVPPSGIIDGGGSGGGGGNEGDDTDSDIDVTTKPIEFILPVTNGKIIMDFANDLPVFNLTLNQHEFHLAIDFKSDENQDVFAVYDGTVTDVRYDILEGTVITIKHNDELSTVYGSLDENVNVKKGDVLRKGDLIGKASDSAYNEFKDGEHVHFEVWKNNKRINPREYLKILDK